MNGLLWIAQIILAVTFFVTGTGKLFAYTRLMGVVERRAKGGPSGISRGLAAFIGVAEIVGALAVIAPPALTPAPLASDYLLIRLAAMGLALIMVLAGIYHLRRREEAAPAVTLFLLALLVIVERWPR
jgi:uncharacterized membrane protein YphA (DoxX/SURF4 family)